MIPAILQPLAKHRESIHVFTGLTLDGAHAHGDGGGDHARSGASFLTGSHPRKTDVQIFKTRFRSIKWLRRHWGRARLDSPRWNLDSKEALNPAVAIQDIAVLFEQSVVAQCTSPLAKEIDPAAVFDRLFGGAEVAGAAKTKQSVWNDERVSSILPWKTPRAFKIAWALPTNENSTSISMQCAM